jgi:hypothetical protein
MAADRWPEEQLVVTHLLTAETGTVLASTQSNSRAELRLKRDVPNLPVAADVSAGFEVANSESMTLQVTGRGLTPVARVFGTQKPLLGRMKTVYGTVQPFRTGQLDDAAFADLLDEAAEEPEVVLGEMDQLDFLPD